MAYLCDTNILLRLLEPETPMGEQARDAFKALRQSGQSVFVTPQNLIEFWNGATWPIENNGFGLTPEQADDEVTRILELFPLMPDTTGVFEMWRKIVREASVRGVQVHDARLAAVMQVHGLTHILTFNVRHLARFGVVAVSPTQILAAPQASSDE